MGEILGEERLAFMGVLHFMVFPVLKGLFRYELIDHYAILGVPIGAEMDKIRTRYLKIAYCLHPDTCKVKTPEGKQQASQLLSRLVNPSYEKLSREASRSEYLIVLSQTSRLITSSDLNGVEGKAAKKLATTDKNLELVYLKLLSLLTESQYTDLDNIYEKIAEISELNLVYLQRGHGEGIKPKQQERSTVSISPATINQAPTSETDNTKKTTSGLEIYLRRGQEALDRQNYDQVILEMRDALKIDPKNARCHALMGLAYLRKNQLSMAKVYVDTALKADPDDPLVKQARSEYNKAAPHASATKSKKEQEDDSKKTGFWNWTKFK